MTRVDNKTLNRTASEIHRIQALLHHTGDADVNRAIATLIGFVIEHDPEVWSEKCDDWGNRSRVARAYPFDKRTARKPHTITPGEAKDAKAIVGDIEREITKFTGYHGTEIRNLCSRLNEALDDLVRNLSTPAVPLFDAEPVKTLG